VGPRGTAQTADQARSKIQTLFWAHTSLISKIQELDALFQVLSGNSLVCFDLIRICQRSEFLAAHVTDAAVFDLNLLEQLQA